MRKLITYAILYPVAALVWVIDAVFDSIENLFDHPDAESGQDTQNTH